MEWLSLIGYIPETNFDGARGEKDDLVIHTQEDNVPMPSWYHAGHV